MSEPKVEVESNPLDVKPTVSEKMFDDCYSGDCQASTVSAPSAQTEISNVCLTLPDVSITGVASS